MNPEKALPSDIPSLYSLVNTSYRLEVGSIGVAFKNNDRYNNEKETEEDIKDYWVIRDNEEIIACVKATQGEGKVFVGPLAVKEEHKRKGLGNHLMTFCEGLSPVTEIGVVSCRTDILPWYKRRGFEEIDSYPAEDFRPKLDLTREGIRMIIMQKRRNN